MRDPSLATLAFGMLCFGTMAGAHAESQIERGHYLITIMDCSGCHTNGSLIGKPDAAQYLAGADIGWAIPGLGVVYPRNITPDKETGIGNWSSDDIVKLLRTGVRPDGREVAGIMNWRSYGQMSDADVHAVAAYLRSIPPVSHTVSGPTPLDAVKTPYFTVARP